MKTYRNIEKSLWVLLLLVLALLALGSADIALAQDEDGEEVAAGADADDVVAPPAEPAEKELKMDNILLTVFGGSAAAIALAALLLALGAWAYPRLKREEQGYVFEDEIEAVLLPLIHDAVHTVHEMTITRLREVGGAELSAEQKQVLFAELYRLIVPVDLKRFVSMEQWQEWGQAVYDGGRTTVIDFAGHLDGMLEKWETEAA